MSDRFHRFKHGNRIATGDCGAGFEKLDKNDIAKLFDGMRRDADLAGISLKLIIHDLRCSAAFWSPSLLSCVIRERSGAEQAEALP